MNHPQLVELQTRDDSWFRDILNIALFPKNGRGQKNYSIVFDTEGFLSFKTTFIPI